MFSHCNRTCRYSYRCRAGSEQVRDTYTLGSLCTFYSAPLKHNTTGQSRLCFASFDWALHTNPLTNCITCAVTTGSGQTWKKIDNKFIQKGQRCSNKLLCQRVALTNEIWLPIEEIAPFRGQEWLFPNLGNIISSWFGYEWPTVGWNCQIDAITFIEPQATSTDRNRLIITYLQ